MGGCWTSSSVSMATRNPFSCLTTLSLATKSWATLSRKQSSGGGRMEKDERFARALELLAIGLWRNNQVFKDSILFNNKPDRSMWGSIVHNDGQKRQCKHWVIFLTAIAKFFIIIAGCSSRMAVNTHFYSRMLVDPHFSITASFWWILLVIILTCHLSSKYPLCSGKTTKISGNATLPCMTYKMTSYGDERRGRFWLACWY